MTRVRGNLKSQEMFRNVPTFETHSARLPLGIICNWCQSGELAQIRANGSVQISSKGVEQIRRSRVLQKSVPEFHSGVVRIGAHHLCGLEQGDFNPEFNFCKLHISSNNQRAMHILTSWGLIYIISIFANHGNNVNWGTSNSCMQLLD